MLTNPKLSAKGEAEALAPRFTGRSILRLLDKQKAIVLTLWLAGSIAAVILVWRLAPVYKGETLIMVEGMVPATTELRERVANLRHQILAVERLEQLIQKFGLNREREKATSEDLIEEMRRDISIKVEKGRSKDQPAGIRVAYHSRKPEVAAAVANQLGAFFVEENSKARESQAKGASELLEDSIQVSRRQLEAQEARLSEYKRLNRGELPEEKDALMSTLQRLQLELQGAHDSISRTQQQRLIVENVIAAAGAGQSEPAKMAEPAPNPSAEANSIPAAAPAVEAATGGRKRSEIMEEELDGLMRRYTSTHPDVLSLTQELRRVRRAEQRDARLAADLAAVEHHRLTGVEKAPRLSPLEPSQPVVGEKDRMAGLKAQKEALDRELRQREEERGGIVALIATYQRRLEIIPLREQELAGLERDYQITRSNYDSLLNNKLSAGAAPDVDRRQTAGRFVIVDKARLPEHPERLEQVLLALGGSIVALAMGMGLALVRELKRNVVLGEWEMPSSVVVLGRIPPIRISAAESTEAEV